jgi:hypothetical protein
MLNVRLNMIVLPRWALTATMCALIFAALRDTADGCGGCFRLPYQSLLEKIENSGRVVVARSPSTAGDSWNVDHVIKGEKFSADESLLVAAASNGSGLGVYGPHILCWDQYTNSWRSEGSADGELIEFLSGAVSAKPGQADKASIRRQAQALRYFLPYLEHADNAIADSAHAQLAKTPYRVLQELAPHLDSDALRTWIGGQRVTVQKRGALYITLLGVCGEQRDSAMLDEWLQENWAGGQAGYLAALLTAHIELNGDTAIRMIEKTYLRNGERSLDEIIAAVDALRTHGEAGMTIPRARVQASFYFLLRERPALAEMIIDDFIRWQDWSVAPQLMQILIADKQPWNTALIIKYLEACPLPEAKQFLQQHILNDQTVREAS